MIVTPPGVAGGPQSRHGLTWCRRVGSELPQQRRPYHSGTPHSPTTGDDKSLTSSTIREARGPTLGIPQGKEDNSNGCYTASPSGRIRSQKRPQE